MQRLFSPSAGQVFLLGLHHSIPADAVEISEAQELDMIGHCPPGYAVTVGSNGELIHVSIPEPEQTADNLCHAIDTAADAARQAVAGDPLRAVEYDRARIEAEQYAAADYQGDVPPMVAAWAINGRTPQQAADSILAEAAQYTAALVYLRTVRLNAKELIRNAMAAGQVAQAEDIAAETIASIQAAVAGIGNNA